MAHHFIISPEQIEGRKVYITGNDLEHLSRVLRLKPGAGITIADGRGKIYRCILQQVTKSKAVAQIETASTDHTEPPVDVVLLQGLPKGDKLELIIQKATELGVSQVIPIAMARSIVKLSESKAEARRKRWQKIAHEAAKQCRRGFIPGIGPLVTLDKALAQLHKDTLILLPWEEEHAYSLREALGTEKAISTSRIALIIGPEGGFREEEVILAKERGAVSLSLGPRILRTETAGLAALAIIMYQLGDLGGHQGWLEDE